MKLLRYGLRGEERPGLLDKKSQLRDLSSHVPEINGATLAPESLERLRRLEPSTLPLVAGAPRLGAPVAGVGKFICIGLNYADHAHEAGMALPSEPIIFLKATSAISGPTDAIEIPRGSQKTDWEVELGVVIGTRAKYVAEGDAIGHVAGYCAVNDVSERHLQAERGGQWTKGKSHDTFGPLGPWLVSADEVPDPQNLKLWLEVDGKRYQNGNTGTMIFTVAQIISYLSQVMTLEPGDVIATGTPPGVGMGQKPEPLYLKAGQMIRLGVEGLGEQAYETVPA